MIESGSTANLDDVDLSEYSTEEEVWHCNDDYQPYLVTESHPIRRKLCDSDNYQLLSSTVCLVNNKMKIKYINK